MEKKKKRVYKMEVDDNGLSPISTVSLVSSPAIEVEFVALNKQEIKLAQVDDEKRVVTGPLLIPDKLIPRFDDNGEEYDIVFTADTIEKLSRLYLKEAKLSSVNIEHSSFVKDVYCIESWIKSSEIDKSVALGFDQPIGTWFVTYKVDNEELWQEIKLSNSIHGFSIEAELLHTQIELSSDTELLAAQKLEELKKVLEEYLTTVTSISSIYAGDAPSASGSLQN
jgi:hypothetical protein